MGPGRCLVDARFVTKVMKEVMTLGGELVTAGEGDVGGDKGVREGVDVELAGEGGEPVRASRPEHDLVGVGAGPDGFEGGGLQGWVGTTIALDDHDVVDDRHDLDYPYIIDGGVADGDELTGDERVGGEGIVVCGRRVAECAEGSDVDQRALERSTSAVFGDSASGWGESFGDSAWSSPGDDVRTSSSGVFQLFCVGGAYTLTRSPTSCSLLLPCLFSRSAVVCRA